MSSSDARPDSEETWVTLRRAKELTGSSATRLQSLGLSDGVDTRMVDRPQGPLRQWRANDLRVWAQSNPPRPRKRSLSDAATAADSHVTVRDQHAGQSRDHAPAQVADETRPDSHWRGEPKLAPTHFELDLGRDDPVPALRGAIDTLLGLLVDEARGRLNTYEALHRMFRNLESAEPSSLPQGFEERLEQLLRDHGRR